MAQTQAHPIKSKYCRYHVENLDFKLGFSRINTNKVEATVAVCSLFNIVQNKWISTAWQAPTPELRVTNTDYLANAPISSGVEKCRRPVGFPLNFPLPAPDPMAACPRTTPISITTLSRRTLPKLRHRNANPTRQRTQALQADSAQELHLKCINP